VSCSVWPPSLLEAAFFFCYSSTALAGGYSCVTLTPYPYQQKNKPFPFVSELMDVLWTGKDQSQVDQPDSLAEGPPM